MTPAEKEKLLKRAAQLCRDGYPAAQIERVLGTHLSTLRKWNDRDFGGRYALRKPTQDKRHLQVPDAEKIRRVKQAAKLLAEGVVTRKVEHATGTRLEQLRWWAKQLNLRVDLRAGKQRLEVAE